MIPKTLQINALVRGDRWIVSARVIGNYYKYIGKYFSNGKQYISEWKRLPDWEKLEIIFLPKSEQYLFTEERVEYEMNESTWNINN